MNYKVKYLPAKKGKEIGINKYPNFHKSGSIKGMKKLFYGESALLVQCGDYIYNVTSNPHIYYNYAH